MDETNTVAADGLDTRRLAQWMDDAGLPGAGRELTASRLPGGSQNQLFEVRRGGHRIVLRAAPPHASPDRAARMLREFDLVHALRDTDVPHARAYAACDDTAIIGQPFYAMDHVDGWSPTAGGWPAPFDHDLAARAGLGTGLVDGIARLARVDWRAAGLEDFGHPQGFHDRQVDRWLSFLDRYKFRELPGLEEAAAWLRAHRPRAWAPGIMHGDYQFANVMYGHGAPARLAAIVDWEMTTIGDPLLDLGWALIAWPPDHEELPHYAYVDYTGMPSRDDLLEHYASVSGRDVDEIDYYVVLARFKLGIVLEQSVARVVSGDPDERVASFAAIVPELIRSAADLAERSAL